jgi:integrase
MDERREKPGKPKGRGNGEGSIFERKGENRQGKKNWVAEFTLPNGRKKTIYCGSYKEAQQALRRALKEQEEGKLILDKDQSIKQYLEFWFENVHKTEIREATYITQRHLLVKHILPELGHYFLRQLSPDHIEAFYARKRQAKLSSGYIKNMHVLLHKAFAHALRQNKVSRNVFDLVTPVRSQASERDPLTIAQAHKLLAAAKGNPLEVILTLGLVTGMRRGEMFALRWQCIDFEQRTLRVLRTVCRFPGYGFVESEPKTARSKRTITLPLFLVEKLKQHRTRQLEARLKAGESWHENDLVFPNAQGTFLDPAHFSKRFHKLLDKAGLPHIHFHDLRHSAATILIAMGVPAKVVQEILGHSNVSITLGLYGHVTPGMHEEAMNKMGELFGG